MAIHKALERQRLAGNQATQPPISVPAPLVVEPVLDELILDVTPINADNLSDARRPVGLPEELAVC